MKKLIVILMGFVFLFTAAGCSKIGVKMQSQGRIRIFASMASAEGFRQTIIDGMKSYADSNNIDLHIEMADENVEIQTEQIKEAKDEGYDVIVCILADPDTSQQIINEAGDIPIVFTNVEPDESRLKSDKYIFVGSNEEDVVKDTVEYLSSRFENNKSFNAVLIEGNRSQKSTSIRTDNLKRELKKNGFDINYVFEDSANWDRGQGEELFKTFLKLNKEYDCVICNNDEMALGVIKAMEENGIDPSSVPILGVDAESEACQAVLDGKMAFTIKQWGEEQGENIIKSARILSAEVLREEEKIKDLEYADDSGKHIWIPYSKVDKSNAGEYIN